MAVDEIAELRVARDPRDAESGGQVVGLEFALKATLELQQRTVLDEKQSESTEVAIAQGVADFAIQRTEGHLNGWERIYVK